MMTIRFKDGDRIGWFFYFWTSDKDMSVRQDTVTVWF